MADTLLVERRGAVCVVTLNLPAKRNALAEELYPLLADTLTKLQNETSVRALVITGGKHFCAGGDLGALNESALELRRAMQAGQVIVRALAGGRLPAVAAVQGNAYGAGFSIALACDFIVADQTANFCAAFGRVGLAPDYGLLWTLPQRVGIAKTREIVMFCESISGTEALKLGLVDRWAEPDCVLETALTMADKLAEAAPGAISAIKAVLSRMPFPLDTLLAWEADTQALLLSSRDFQEGILAFTEKRRASFEGK